MAEYSTDIINFLIGKNGQLEVADFEPRTMKMALKPFLKKGWKKSPKLLVKAMRQSPDLMGMVLSIRNGFAGYLEETRVNIEVQIGEKTELLLKELDDVAREKFDPMNDEELTRLYDMLNVVDLFLWSIEENSPPEWVLSLVPEEYEMVVDLVKKTIKGDVTEDSFIFNPAYDTAEGAAVTLMMELSPEQLDALDIRFGWADMFEAPLAVSTEMAVEKLNAECEKMGLRIAFAKKGAKKSKTGKASKVVKPAESEVIDVEPVKTAPKAAPVKKTATKAAPKATVVKKTVTKTAAKPTSSKVETAKKTADTKSAVKAPSKSAAKKPVAKATATKKASAPKTPTIAAKPATTSKSKVKTTSAAKAKA